MTFYMIYETATGRQLSLTPVDTDPLQPGESRADLGDWPISPYESGQMWDPATRTLVARPTNPPPVDRLDDLVTSPLFQAYRDAVQALRPNDRGPINTAVRNLVITLLGRRRFRGYNEPVEVD